MADDRQVVFEINQQIFGAAAERHDAPSAGNIGKPFRQRKAQIGPVEDEFANQRILHRRRQSAANGFHLWQFGHDVPNFLFRRPLSWSIDPSRRSRLMFIALPQIAMTRRFRYRPPRLDTKDQEP